MDNIILGLLFLQNRTIYQLRERIDKGLSLMYSSSTGSIQAAIKKLLAQGFIEFENILENSKHKKIYSITKSGRHSFNEWINTPITGQISKHPELTKIYFLGYSTPENRIKIIEEHIQQLTQQYEILKAICEDGQNIKVNPKHKDIVYYQLATARYGRDQAKFTIKWYKDLLNKQGA
ncbi:MAG TPA: PadR family transcriptional regulator [Gallicola sp.]|nr:PadR family transcriptional regulator [Gallicola sp.]